MKSVILLLGAAGLASAMELTKANWDSATAGKTVFVKFLAPWCGHCKSMKPAWDKLMKKYDGHATALVGDVDCTADGKPLCEEFGVEGFPTIKWGDPAALEVFEGGRDFDSLKKFADENLKPLCSPKNIDLCDDEKKAKIKELQAMSMADLQAAVDANDEEATQAGKTFDEEVEKLQKRYEELDKEKTEKIKAIKDSGLGLMKAVLAAGKSKEEL